ncbi:MAG: hypothetical protein M0P36_06090 [Bacteroidales bacterium]|nr:hypothetical protein [Bacteroidales bacterium]
MKLFLRIYVEFKMGVLFLQKSGGFGVIFVAKQNKNHDKTGGNRKVLFFKIKVDKIHKLLA